MCILNCCKVINNLLLNVSIESDVNPPGADDFLPVLIYVTMKASSVLCSFIFDQPEIITFPFVTFTVNIEFNDFGVVLL